MKRNSSFFHDLKSFLPGAITMHDLRRRGGEAQVNTVLPHPEGSLPVGYRLVVVGELACLNDPESYTVGGLPPAGSTLAGRSKDRGQTKG